MKKLLIGILLIGVLVSGCSPSIQVNCFGDFNKDFPPPARCGVVYDCYIKCYEIGYDYLKYDSSGFGSTECWCLKDNTKPIQLW